MKTEKQWFDAVVTFPIGSEASQFFLSSFCQTAIISWLHEKGQRNMKEISSVDLCRQHTKVKLTNSTFTINSIAITSSVLGLLQCVPVSHIFLCTFSAVLIYTYQKHHPLKFFMLNDWFPWYRGPPSGNVLRCSERKLSLNCMRLKHGDG